MGVGRRSTGGALDWEESLNNLLLACIASIKRAQEISYEGGNKPVGESWVEILVRAGVPKEWVKSIWRKYL